MLVKICGITTKDAADVAVKAGADYIGFVFAESSRQISPKEAAIIASSLPAFVKKVGVFVNETVETMKETAQTVGLDTIQLHGDEPPEVAKQLPYEIIKAFPVNKDTLPAIRSYPCDFYLLDSLVDSRRGGSGITFDWSLADQLSINRAKVMLAGGLTPENVKRAINTVRPAAVDVSSGVETNKEKDLDKIEQFIRNAKLKAGVER